METWGRDGATDVFLGLADLRSALAGRPWAKSSPLLSLLTLPPNPTKYYPAGDTPLKPFPHKSLRHRGWRDRPPAKCRDFAVHSMNVGADPQMAVLLTH